MIYYICDRPDKQKCRGNHCQEYCPHGRPHKADGCTTDSECHIDCARKKGDVFIHNGWVGCKKSLVVKCRPANKKELHLWGLV